MSKIVHTVHKYICVRRRPVEQLTGKYNPFTGKTFKAYKCVSLALLRKGNKKVYKYFRYYYNTFKKSAKSRETFSL
jgi:hypothetical protein